MKVCPKCKETYIDFCDDIQYCIKDGDKLVKRETHECGFENIPLAKFCAKCGKSINQEVK
jgi:uncharacterized OB-fold protein